jgi:hypothetical protein
MNTDPRMRWRRIAFAAPAAVALFGVLTLVAGCGSSSSASKASTSDPRERALAYAKCIRANGVPDFPDPDASGQFRGPAHEQAGNPAFRAALQKCRGLAPGGEHEATGDPAFVEAMRQFSKCMRAHGLPDFPDPDANGRLRGLGHEREGNPKYAAAAEACRDKLPGGGQHGSGAGS